jgi:hypothetical protein
MLTCSIIVFRCEDKYNHGVAVVRLEPKPNQHHTPNMQKNWH